MFFLLFSLFWVPLFDVWRKKKEKPRDENSVTNKIKWNKSGEINLQRSHVSVHTYLICDSDDNNIFYSSAARNQMLSIQCLFFQISCKKTEAITAREKKIDFNFTGVCVTAENLSINKPLFVATHRTWVHTQHQHHFNELLNEAGFGCGHRETQRTRSEEEIEKRCVIFSKR